MKKAWIFMSIPIILLTVNFALAEQKCKTRQEIMDKHVVFYRAYNNTTRGCQVTPNFYTQQHKQGRGHLSRRFIIKICEGEPKTSPRIGQSFQICPPPSKRKPEKENEKEE